ncbi:ferrous iron transport protein A [Malaciobacter marinus]|uniref:Ferrous iron transport protein A n=1 Tax=Malaciobacter marinus TaxID=505249 RepID=A0AB36ZRF9_9BACT|nr:FeoA family protein [Malaciobacter marinus]PPK57258.1 ferrous iron transport protein A [Malaciobacter marinus]SKB71363.1 ferrous iron transport protein A [Malaciobacter marinus]
MNKKLIMLDTLSKGQKAKIKKIRTDGKLLRRLLDMGFVMNSEIEVIREAPLFDPMELKIQNYYISIRKSEASLIEVKI